MNLADIIFITLAVITLVGAFFAVHAKNIFHNALFFGMSLLGIAGFFVLLGSEFLGLVEILIYVGAILIAIIFAIMISPALSQKLEPRSLQKQIVSALASFLTGGALFYLLLRYGPDNWKAPISFGASPFNIQILGKALLSEYGLPFELVSVILLIAILGALLNIREQD